VVSFTLVISLKKFHLSRGFISPYAIAEQLTTMLPSPDWSVSYYIVALSPAMRPFIKIFYHLLSGRIACMQRICGLLLPMLHVAWSACLCVGQTGLLCKNGWTDRDAVWDTDSCGPMCYKWGQGRTNPFLAASSYKTGMRPFAKLLWTLIIIIIISSNSNSSLVVCIHTYVSL